MPKTEQPNPLQNALRSSDPVHVRDVRDQRAATLCDWLGQVAVIIAARGEHVPKYLQTSRERIKNELIDRAEESRF